MLTPPQLEQARHTLGTMWKLGRPLSQGELRICLELQNPKAIRDLERGHNHITGPVSVAVSAMLAGYIPECAPEEAWRARAADMDARRVAATRRG